MDNKTIELIYNVFKNCNDHFDKTASIDNSKNSYNSLLKIIKRFKSRKQLLNTIKNNKRYVSKGKINIKLLSNNPECFLSLCLFAVLTNCNLQILVSNEDNFASNELIRSLVCKVCEYYGEKELISYEKGDNKVVLYCDYQGKSCLISNDLVNFKRLNQQDFLTLKA